jgi:hypothetical protein
VLRAHPGHACSDVVLGGELRATSQRRSVVRDGTLGHVGQRNTLETNPANTVLVVGGPQALIESAKVAAKAVPVAEVVTCELRDAPTRVAELWPFAIVMSEDLYTFDAAEFDALARDVKARLITVIVGASLTPSEKDLREKILEAYRRRMA